MTLLHLLITGQQARVLSRLNTRLRELGDCHAENIDYQPAGSSRVTVRVTDHVSSTTLSDLLAFVDQEANIALERREDV